MIATKEERAGQPIFNVLTSIADLSQVCVTMWEDLQATETAEANINVSKEEGISQVQGSRLWSP
jgi:hypothetical protein